MISNEAKLAQYQLWRIGADERTLDEVGLTPSDISESINGVLGELAAIRQKNSELVGALQEAKLALESSYDVADHPGGLRSRQGVVANDIGELLAKLDGE